MQVSCDYKQTSLKRNDDLSKIKDAITYGKYYNPASEHYKDKYPNGNCVITCDNCGKSPLQSCIGYNDIDICLSCAESSEIPKTPPQPTTPWSQSPWVSERGLGVYTMNTNYVSFINEEATL